MNLVIKTRSWNSSSVPTQGEKSLDNFQLNGTGIGFRPEHAMQILTELPDIPWFELLIDNYMADNASLSPIDKLVEDYPIAFHGVGLSIGSTTPLDYEYLKGLKRLKDRWQPKQISDHFAWTGTGDYHFHELLPLPTTQETISHLLERISRVQDFLGDPILLENPSTYIKAPAEMSEWEFINEVCKSAGCGLLLDVNNVHVNAFNHGFNPDDYLAGIDLSHVRELHLGGYEDCGDYYFDSHSQPVSTEVWSSYQKILAQIPYTPSLLEWDNQLPDLSVILNEAKHAEKIRSELLMNSSSKFEKVAI